MKHIKLKDVTKTVKFLDQDLEIKQLTVKSVKELQGQMKDKEGIESLDTLGTIFKSTVVGAEDMTMEDFEKFPMLALVELSKQILEYNGLNAQDEKGKELGK